MLPASNLRKVEQRERATGIEPALSAWEADVMPFHYARIWLPLRLGPTKRKARAALSLPRFVAEANSRSVVGRNGRVANHVT